MKPSRYDQLHRIIDPILAGAALLLLSPLLLITAGVVALTLGRPVLFRQVRPGRGGRPFTLVKFRTMRDIDPARGLVSDADRLTPVGRVLRATSLDELPTFWNVLRGDLALIGPRPMLMSYLDRYTPRQARRNEVRPGITGLAQARGRNAMSWEERFELDVWFVDHRSFGLDLRIIAQTVVTVLRGAGVSAPGHATMPEFKGVPVASGEVRR